MRKLEVTVVIDVAKVLVAIAIILLLLQ